MGKAERLLNIYVSCRNLYLATKRLKPKWVSERRVLKRNAHFRDLYKGKTCFILGTGPSLSNEPRLAELRGQVTFSTNQLFRSDIYDKVNPTFHVMVDPAFFSFDPDNPSQNEVISLLKKAYLDTSRMFFFPYEGKQWVDRYLGVQDNAFFVEHLFSFRKNYKGKIDMTNLFPAAQNVVIAAIFYAIYMGFSRIVLLGCDQTGLMDYYIRRSPKRQRRETNHIYKASELEIERENEQADVENNLTLFREFARTFEEFAWLVDFCKKRNIVLVNASSTTALDVVPFTSLDEELDRITNHGQAGH